MLHKVLYPRRTEMDSKKKKKETKIDLALTEYDMRSIEPGRCHSGDEELRTIGAAASIGHGEKGGLIVL